MDQRWLPELDLLNLQAHILEQLPPSEDFADEEGATALHDFSYGEATNQEILTERLGLQRLSYFLNCFFGEVEYAAPEPGFHRNLMRDAALVTAAMVGGFPAVCAVAMGLSTGHCPEMGGGPDTVTAHGAWLRVQPDEYRSAVAAIVEERTR